MRCTLFGDQYLFLISIPAQPVLGCTRGERCPGHLESRGRLLFSPTAQAADLGLFYIPTEPP